MANLIPCPCGGRLKTRKEKVVQDSIDCGILAVELCSRCGTRYLPEESILVVEEKLKKAGLWGVPRREIKLWKTGNAVTIRIPTSIVQNLHLSEIDKGYLYQEGPHKLVIEV